MSFIIILIYAFPQGILLKNSYLHRKTIKTNKRMISAKGKKVVNSKEEFGGFIYRWASKMLVNV